MVIALAVALITSVGPASAWAAEGSPEGVADDAARPLGLVAQELAGDGLTAAWLSGLGAIIDAARAAAVQVTKAAVAETSAQVGRSGARQRPSSGPFSMNLYARGDFVSQKTTYWCIPASTQVMMNMMDIGRPDRSRALQARLYRVGDRLEEDGTFSDEREPDGFRGMGISEWAGLLNRYDYGPYGLAGYKSRQNALRVAAHKMRKTGKPVKLVVWHGAHAWVMSGFTATADPAQTKDFTVTSVVVHDPWYPRVSSFWGRSRPPNARVTPKVLGQDFKRYGRPSRRNPERDGRYMLVLPGRSPETLPA